MAGTTATQPFVIDIPDDVLDDLNRRLDATRWPHEPSDPEWTFGANPSYMREFVDYWRSGYDWRKQEKSLNRHKHFKVDIETADAGLHNIHFIHEKGSGSNPKPLIISHGWPSSFTEMDAIIEPLAHPEKFGGNAEEAFDVIVPSLPGYGFSSLPGRPTNPRKTAGLFAKLMTDVLGYEKFYAQGGDWGSLITSWLAFDNPQAVAAIHLNMVGLRPWTGPGTPPKTQEEKAFSAEALGRLSNEGAYFRVQATKPQSLAVGMTDSPAGMAAWIVEKFHTWSHHDGNVEDSFSKDQLLNNLMIYWVTGSFNSASWMYYAATHDHSMALPEEGFIEQPTGFAFPPRDLIPQPPDSWPKRSYNVIHRVDMPHGGHFVALEEPEQFITDVREFFNVYANNI